MTHQQGGPIPGRGRERELERAAEYSSKEATKPCNRVAGTPPGSVVSEGILLLLGQLHKVHLDEHVVLVQVGHLDRRTEVLADLEGSRATGLADGAWMEIYQFQAVSCRVEATRVRGLPSLLTWRRLVAPELHLADQQQVLDLQRLPVEPLGLEDVSFDLVHLPPAPGAVAVGGAVQLVLVQLAGGRPGNTCPVSSAPLCTSYS